MSTHERIAVALVGAILEWFGQIFHVVFRTRWGLVFGIVLALTAIALLGLPNS